MSAFRDLGSQFAGKNAQVLGVSKDDLDTQKRFAKSLSLPFPLLSDAKGEVAKAYGVDAGAYAKRTTIVIGPDRKITNVIEGQDALEANGALAACPLHKGG